MKRFRLFPSIPDLLFCAILLWLFASGAGWSVLLADGDTGWHIRNGQQILQCRCVPYADPFAFGSAGHPWFAWEWLADVMFAALFSAGGLKAIVLFAGIVIAITPSVLFRQLQWKGVGIFTSLAVTLVATGASTIHFLARPHVFTLLFTVIAAWALESDWRTPSGRIWGLPVLAVLWTNLHGGFLVLFTLLAASMIESAFIDAKRIRRYGVLTLLCGLATFINPYGWQLHRHLLEFLNSDWIRQSVEEFQSPRFRSESMLQFEILLALGIGVIPFLWRQRRIAEACLIVFWGQQALGSVRHVPIYCLLAAPAIAFQLDRWWRDRALLAPAAGISRMLREIDSDWIRSASGFSALPVLIGACLIFIPGAGQWPNEFPEIKFPTALVSRNASLLADPGARVRVFSSDQWSDYLIYRLHPQVLTYFDGRSDFFGPWRGDDYARLMEGRPGCAAILIREGVRYALVPATWPLAGLLSTDAHWKTVDADRQAILFGREGA